MGSARRPDSRRNLGSGASRSVGRQIGLLGPANGRHLPQRAGEQAGQRAARRLLLGLLLGGAFGLSELDRAAGGIGDPDLDAKALAVVGTTLVGQQVPG